MFLAKVKSHFPFLGSKDIESGLQSGVTRTPTLFINGIRYTDAWKMEALLAAITKAVNLL